MDGESEQKCQPMHLFNERKYKGGRVFVSLLPSHSLIDLFYVWITVAASIVAKEK